VSVAYGNAQHIADVCNKSMIRSPQAAWHVIRMRELRTRLSQLCLEKRFPLESFPYLWNDGDTYTVRGLSHLWFYSKVKSLYLDKKIPTNYYRIMLLSI